jgi:alkylhydroperoxidase/carboxymuconolactone decarboxylase family protein YurZ
MAEESSIIDRMLAIAGPALPQSHVEYAERDPELFAAYNDVWRRTCLEAGALSKTHKLLMVVALLTAQKNTGPLKVYASIARAEGATAQELKEALRVGVLFSGGAGIDAAAAVAGLLED